MRGRALLAAVPRLACARAFVAGPRLPDGAVPPRRFRDTSITRLATPAARAGVPLHRPGAADREPRR